MLVRLEDFRPGAIELDPEVGERYAYLQQLRVVEFASVEFGVERFCRLLQKLDAASLGLDRIRWRSARAFRRRSLCARVPGPQAGQFSVNQFLDLVGGELGVVLIRVCACSQTFASESG
jgi:hypothetical protein